MEDFQRIEKERLLLVEGRDTEAFFTALADDLQLTDLFQFRNYGGTSDLRQALQALSLSPNFEQVTHLGIIRDYEYGSNAFQSITDSLGSVGMAVPSEPFTLEIGEPSVMIAILPDGQTPGNLEDLCLRAFATDDAMSCIEDYINCLENKGKSIIDSQLAKAKMQMIVASKSIDQEIPRRQRKVWHMSYGMQKRWWPWDHPAFDEVKTFLTELAT